MDGESVLDCVESDAEEPIKSGIPGAVFNLTNTVLGGGISLISLPLAAKKAGIVVMPTIEVISFGANCFTCYLLVVTAHHSGEKSFSSLGKRFLGRAHMLVLSLIHISEPTRPY
eukprot:TRINITY_DN13191_c0_g1_i2.p1 TRINITY_DN13191_c0_g1~~TRINITY_DN13191_c0_g1_i2.p1  ORF type:complete len:114 (-),score=33.37 TRINITY_DN13191_c0_g1_i2:73-414(-)